MAQVLSQDEVDALLSAVSDSDDESIESSDYASEDDLSIQAYDLTNQDRVIRGRMPILEIIYERFLNLRIRLNLPVKRSLLQRLTFLEPIIPSNS